MHVRGAKAVAKDAVREIMSAGRKRCFVSHRLEEGLSRSKVHGSFMYFDRLPRLLVPVTAKRIGLARHHGFDSSHVKIMSQSAMVSLLFIFQL